MLARRKKLLRPALERIGHGAGTEARAERHDDQPVRLAAAVLGVVEPQYGQGRRQGEQRTLSYRRSPPQG
jgi:hypothetical protein